MAEKRPSGAKSAPILLRLIKMLFSFYPVMLPVALGCILFNAALQFILGAAKAAKAAAPDRPLND